MTITAERDRATKATKLLEAAATEIVHTYAATRRQLEQWAAGFPSTCIGASPPTGGPSTDEERIDLTAVESLASSGSGAVPKLHQLDSQLEWVSVCGRRMWAAHDGVDIPDPVTTDAARLAVMMWAIRRTQRDPLAIGVGHLERYLGSVQQLADHCRRWAPPLPPLMEDQCHTHAAARSSELIDARYRRWQMCRWCGDFRKLHGVNPPPSLVRDHDRGINLSAVRLRNAGIRTIA